MLNAGNEIEAGSANGKGTLIVSGDSSGSGGLDQWTNTSVTYNIASNGRGTAEAQGDKAAVGHLHDLADEVRRPDAQNRCPRRPLHPLIMD